MEYQKPTKLGNKIILGYIFKVKEPSGNVLTNISRVFFEELNPNPASFAYRVEIFHKNKVIYQGTVPFVRAFEEIASGRDLIYPDSENQIGLAIKEGNFAYEKQIIAGRDWSIKITRLDINFKV